MDTKPPANTPTNTTNTPLSTLPQTNGKSARILVIMTVILLVAGNGLLAVPFINARQQSKDDSEKIAELESQIESKDQELADIKDATGEVNVNKDGFQAVFLKNDQVYFGKITKITETQITLENIYYLKTSGPVATDLDNLANDVSLVKLGNELHGPEDVMYIERKEVNFWENLKSDGQVAEAIKAYEAAN